MPSLGILFNECERGLSSNLFDDGYKPQYRSIPYDQDQERPLIFRCLRVNATIYNYSDRRSTSRPCKQVERQTCKGKHKQSKPCQVDRPRYVLHELLPSGPAICNLCQILYFILTIHLPQPQVQHTELYFPWKQGCDFRSIRDIKTFSILRH